MLEVNSITWEVDPEPEAAGSSEEELEGPPQLASTKLSVRTAAKRVQSFFFIRHTSFQKYFLAGLQRSSGR